jgi:hypothetical protein
MNASEVGTNVPSKQLPQPSRLREWLRRRRWLLLSGTTVAALGAAFVLLSRGTAAEDKKVSDNKPGTEVKQPVEVPPLGQQAGEARSQLPIAQVVLFSSGVGYFQREGVVEGDARVDLSFDVRDINDLIKSMVLRDLDGGHVAAVSYDSNAPVERTLKSFAINLNGNPSFSAILNQARGEKIEVVLQQSNAAQPGTLTGTIVGIEEQKQPVGKDAVANVEVLNLWCADGVRSLKMSEVQRVRFLSPILDGEFRKALETLALSHDTAKKAVSINFAGSGKRNVRVGYVVENPIWKTSYRLVLDKDKKAAPYLQGWAVVENPTDEDWKDVRMALVSGRPISFQMDLYTPLYVPRPVVEPELFASLRPVAYSGSMNGVDGAPQLQKKAALEGYYFEKESLDALEKTKAPGLSTSYGLAGAKPTSGEFARQSRQQLEQRMNLGDTTRSVAQAAKLGDFFQYTIDRPVTLPRQKSALLPIITKDVQATRLSIYNEHTQAKFPLLGLRLKNTSSVHLMQGPITVFEGSNYAGDARILDLQPNEERLLSYAVDLGTEVNPVPSSDNGRLTSVKAIKGVVYTTTKVREAKTYTIANRNDQERTVLIEHPVRNDFHLVDTDKPVETAADFHRFEVKVPAGKDGKLVVTEERQINSNVALNNLDDNNIRVFLNSPVTSAKVKSALEGAMKLRWETAKTQREIGEQERQLKVIVEDQTRLRANLKEMPATAAAYKRYLEKFDTQETQIEAFQKEIKRLQDIEHSQKKEFEDYLANLNVE